MIWGSLGATRSSTRVPSLLGEFSPFFVHLPKLPAGFIFEIAHFVLEQAKLGFRLPLRVVELAEFGATLLTKSCTVCSRLSIRSVTAAIISSENLEKPPEKIVCSWPGYKGKCRSELEILA